MENRENIGDLAENESRCLTVRQKKFVESFVLNGGRVGAAAKDAGYSDHARGTYSLSLPHVRSAIAAEIDKQIKCDLASVSVGVMKRLLEDDDTPAHVRFQAARWCLETSGHRAPAEPGPGLKKPLSEMSLAELDQFLEAGRKTLDSLKVIDAEVVTPCPGAQDSAQHTAPVPQE